MRPIPDIAVAGPSGFLLMLVRSFDRMPLGFFSDRAAAESYARSVVAACDPMAPASGAPKVGPGELGPPGIVSRVMGVALVPFVDGNPVADGRSYFDFVPEPVPPKPPAPRKPGRKAKGKAGKVADPGHVTGGTSDDPTG